MLDKYENKRGEIGVIISGGYGAGWSTWNENSEFLSMDKTLVKMKLENAPESDVETYCKKAKGDSPYMGGWNKGRIEWLEKGTAFTIEEYDGFESLRTSNDLNMTA